ncbi:nuclear transport factor 2 family protein [Pseudoflavitalea sp. G-6-1-2]|uniref:nuclear transport factor 2 family protein n=1 Tax=Pseudoflavitalea sp. G-6-1-2 TaxID=2728841 RepID=UPI00146E3D5A|nr:nuclear transport factor 2 family protein [Pseudoflavitalea sp. G-6-1-2]NML22173.1 nuclear transport factor 2 family protein [Pseudoflavitalea sp. G-6-1-2]
MQRYEQLIENFYAALNRRDYRTMAECYHPDVIFYDPVFENLNFEEVKAMWEMLCKRATDLRVTVSNLDSEKLNEDEEYGSCRWVAEYTFTGTGRKVINVVEADFRFRDGLFIEHMDSFDLYKWSKQALGLPGLLLGWSGFIQNPIRKKAKKSLRQFMENRQ